MQLIDEARTERRMIKDACDVLRRQPSFTGSLRARVLVSPLTLPNGANTAVVSVVCSEMSCAVSLPASASFRGANATGFSTRLPIERLHDASTDIDGNVELADGTHLHAVQLIPTVMNFDLSHDDMWLVHSIVHYIEADRERRGLPSLAYYRVVHEAVPDKYLDFSRIVGIADPYPLKTIEGVIAAARDKNPKVPVISRTSLTDLLSKCAMRQPRRSRQRAA